MGRPASERAPALAQATKQRARLAAAQANLAELKAARLRGELVVAAAVESEWVSVPRTVRASMLGGPVAGSVAVAASEQARRCRGGCRD